MRDHAFSFWKSPPRQGIKAIFGSPPAVFGEGCGQVYPDQAGILPDLIRNFHSLGLDWIDFNTRPHGGGQGNLPEISTFGGSRA